MLEKLASPPQPVPEGNKAVQSLHFSSGSSYSSSNCSRSRRQNSPDSRSPSSALGKSPFDVFNNSFRHKNSNSLRKKSPTEINGSPIQTGSSAVSVPSGVSVFNFVYFFSFFTFIISIYNFFFRVIVVVHWNRMVRHHQMLVIFHMT